MYRRTKQAGVLLLFTLCVAFIMCVAAYSLRPNDGHVRTRLEGFYAEEPHSLDAVFVGSSAIYAFVSPLRLWGDVGLTSYLYATPNQSVSMLRYVLEECRKTQPDALYVIELRAMLSSAEDKETIASDLRTMTDNMPYSLTRARMIAALAPSQEQFSYQVDIVKYHERWKDFSFSDLTLIWGRPDPCKGYLFAEMVEPIEAQDHRRENMRIGVDSQNEADLRELLAYCEEEGVRALFIATPYALSRTQAKKYNAVEDIVGEYGFDFLNLNKRIQEIGLDFAMDYSDFRHTNTRGMVKCTAYLGQVLTERCGLPFPKSADCLIAWRDYYEAYAQQEHVILQRIEQQSAGREGDGT